MSKKSTDTSKVKYGTYRETYDKQSKQFNLVNLIVVTSQKEFEWMASHASEQSEESKGIRRRKSLF